MPGAVPSTPNDVAVAQVQSSFWGKGFTIFPNHQTRTACRIPGAGGLGVKGTCETQVAHQPDAATTLVTFTESWPARRFRTHGPPTGTLHHSWRFRVANHGSLSRAGDVQRLGGEGAFPPQASD